MNLNFTAKTKELLNTLEIIENSYNTSSPQYKFTKVFYNIVDTPIEKPFDFPQELWNRYYIPNSSFMPVILNKQQIEERKRLQNDLKAKLVESKSGILKKLESLKFKREMIKNKLQNAIIKFRAKTKKYAFCGEENGTIYKLQTEVIEREKLVIKEKKDAVLKCLIKMREKLERLEKELAEHVHVSENGILLARQLNQ